MVNSIFASSGHSNSSHCGQARGGQAVFLKMRARGPGLLTTGVRSGRQLGKSRGYVPREINMYDCVQTPIPPLRSRPILGDWY